MDSMLDPTSTFFMFRILCRVFAWLALNCSGSLKNFSFKGSNIGAKSVFSGIDVGNGNGKFFNKVTMHQMFEIISERVYHLLLCGLKRFGLIQLSSCIYLRVLLEFYQGGGPIIGILGIQYGQAFIEINLFLCIGHDEGVGCSTDVLDQGISFLFFR